MMEINKISDWKIKKETLTKNGQTYNITYSSNTPSDAALEKFAKAILKISK